MIHLPEPIINWLRPYYFRGKGRIFRKISLGHGTRRTQIFGYDVVLDLADHIQRGIYLGTFEPDETALVRRILRPGMTFIDVGANVGYFTLMAARAVQSSGRVIAFEPSQYLHNRLAATLSANELSHVTLVEAGLGDQAGTVGLYLNPSFGNNSPTMVEHAASEVSQVRVERLDDYLVAHGVACVDLMKIDVEGFEPLVFGGARETLGAGKIKAILCEFNDYWLRTNGSSPSDLWQTLNDAGFRNEDGSSAPPHFPARCVVNHVLFHKSA